MQELSPALPNPTTGAVVYANPTAEQNGGGVQLIEIWSAIRRRQRLELARGHCGDGGEVQVGALAVDNGVDVGTDL